jgi:hypothetical protein
VDKVRPLLATGQDKEKESGAFLKKKPLLIAAKLAPTVSARRQGRSHQSFLVLFFKKEHLASP